MSQGKGFHLICVNFYDVYMPYFVISIIRVCVTPENSFAVKTHIKIIINVIHLKNASLCHMKCSWLFMEKPLTTKKKTFSSARRQLKRQFKKIVWISMEKVSRSHVANELFLVSVSIVKKECFLVYLEFVGRKHDRNTCGSGIFASIYFGFLWSMNIRVINW